MPCFWIWLEPWWLSVIWGNDSNYGAGVLLSGGRAWSGGMVSMAIASASEWLPVTTSWWFNEFITEFQRKTREWMSDCSALQVPKSIAGRAISVSTAPEWITAQRPCTGSLRASKVGEPGTESAATWPAKASVPALLRVWKHRVSLHAKLALFKPDESTDHRNLAQDFRCIPSNIPSPWRWGRGKEAKKEKQTLNPNCIQIEAKEESMSAYCIL